MHRLTFLPLLCALPCLAQTTDLDVNVTAGTFRGVSVANGTERWLGIPFADPPLGPLRFKAPVPLSRPLQGVQNASAFKDACPQPASSTLGAPIGEDCLGLNVWRPAGTKADAKLPVLFWVYGGFLMTGAASEHAFDPTRIIQRSVTNDKPVIFVSANYRVNTFGFLASQHVNGSDLNAGMQDIRAALEFVQDNIAAFGGDPAKVTLWGQSAGGGVVETQVVYPSSRNLFRGAIMDSSTGPFKTSPVPSTYDEPGMPYDRLVKEMNCPTGPASFACLQKVPIATIMNASNAMIEATLNDQLWQPTIGPPGTMIDELSSKRIADGNFLHIPLIGGSNLNDGTLFAGTLAHRNLTGAAQDDALKQYVRDGLIDSSRVTNDTLARLVEIYPQNDTALGAPFNTGDSLFDRGAAFFGDNGYFAPRRRLFQAAKDRQDLWGYFFAEFIPGENRTLGVEHGSELVLLFGPVPEQLEEDFANTLLDFYLNFINDLNPGPAWSKFTAENQQVLQMIRGNLTMIPDDFNSDRTDFLNSPTVLEQFIR